MREDRLLRILIAVAAAGFGAGLSEFAAGTLTLRNGPVAGFGEGVAYRLPDEFIVHNGIDLIPIVTGPLLDVLLVLALLGLAAAASLGLTHGWRGPLALAGLVGVLGLLSEAARPDSVLVDVVPVVVGVLGFLGALAVLTRLLVRAPAAEPAEPEPTEPAEPARDSADNSIPASAQEAIPAVSLASRRAVVIASVVALVAGAGGAVAGELIGRGRRAVEQGRRLLRLTMVTAPQVPSGVGVGVDGVAPWMTPTEDFYRNDDAVVVPAIAAEEWSMRIFGEVEREITLTYSELIDMSVSEQWDTLVGLTYEPGGDQVGNAWFSGVPTHRLLARAGVVTGADAVVQTGDDGWQCVTPTQALSDPDRGALLAFAMNGEALPLEHGFPVRTIVPGSYGGVSACKWVVEWEVTRYDVVAPTWGDDPPLRAATPMSARIDVPDDGAEVEPGLLEIAGVAWAAPQGVGDVEVSVDGGGWSSTTLGDNDEQDSWVQWRASVDLAPGTHLVRARVVDRVGTTQEQSSDPAIAGVSELHEIEVQVSDGT